MCYRDGAPSLNLEGIRLACLCGENGHGKTALLDAMTWALWGRARARTHEELVHQGQQDMSVELSFMARGQRYRVSRKYSRSRPGRQGTTLLELQVAPDNGARPITGNTVRETEAKIVDILHMDYDTFVNTAFLLQGRADLFTTSKPTDRKKRLAEILDLSYYQGLEELAKNRTQGAQREISSIEDAAALRRRETSSKAEFQGEHKAVVSALDDLRPEVDTLRTKLESLRVSVQSLRNRQAELETLRRRLEAGRAEAADLERQVDGHRARVQRFEEALSGRGDVREGFARLGKASEELDRLEKALLAKSGLDGDKARLERDIAVHGERLSGELARVQTRIADELEPKAKGLPEVKGALNRQVLEEGRLAESAEGIRLRRAEAEELDGRARVLNEINVGLMGDMEETRKKFDMLQDGDAVCPLCNKPLGAEGQEHLKLEYETEGRERKRQYTANATEAKNVLARHGALTAESGRLEADLDRQRQALQSKTAVLERDLQDSQQSESQLPMARAELDTLENTLRSGDFASEQRAEVSSIDLRLTALGYNPEAHRRNREEVGELERFGELHRRLVEAEKVLPGEREALVTAQQTLDRRRRELDAEEVRRQELGTELESLPALEAELLAADSSHQRLAAQQNEALVRQGVLESDLKRIARLEKELAGLEEKRRRRVQEKGLYDELAVAFGKNGVQALIIETAIPQLQDEANELLGRLTDNRMFLKLELREGRRERRMGLPSEELDIKISDELGTRSYETFSGGESFRINFALRIALSKLLARRSGAPLPILFIDEGFGSQDSAGQERLKEAIQSIQKDFEKIIVITHVDHIKDAFPTRIEVTKTSMGSTFEVV